MKIDGHIHTPYCPHGSSDTFEQYIQKAISENFTAISFTEHAPLPSNFVDPTPDQDSGMKREYLTPYLNELQGLKEKYKNQISIRIGLEVDYIIGYEQETKNFLNEVGPFLDDAILSVHFLQFNDTYCCIDFSDEVYLQFAQQVGGVLPLYDLYYDTVRNSIEADLGPYKPKRIGHPTLVHKFQHAHKEQIDDATQIEAILRLMKEAGYTLDANSAGLSKPLCLEPYPPLQWIEFAKSIDVPIVFGSDAHTEKDLHQHYSVIFP